MQKYNVMAKSIKDIVRDMLNLHKNASNYTPQQIEEKMNSIHENLMMKKGGWLQKARASMEKRGTVGSFTEYCGGKVTNECIERGLKSKDPKIRRRAAFAKAVRSFKKQYGGIVSNEKGDREYLSQIIYMALGGEFEQEGLTADDMNQMSIDEAREIYKATNENEEEMSNDSGNGDGENPPKKGNKKLQKSKSETSPYNFTHVSVAGPNTYESTVFGMMKFRFYTKVYAYDDKSKRIYEVEPKYSHYLSDLFAKYSNHPVKEVRDAAQLFTKLNNIKYDENKGKEAHGAELYFLLDDILKNPSNHKYFEFKPVEKDIIFKEKPELDLDSYAIDQAVKIDLEYPRMLNEKVSFKAHGPGHKHVEEFKKYVENKLKEKKDVGEANEYSKEWKLMPEPKKPWKGIPYKEEGGEQLPQEQQGQQGKPELSYEEFVQLAMMYPEYVQQLFNDLQQAQQQSQQQQESESQETPEYEEQEEQAMEARRFGETPEQQPTPVGEYLYGGKVRERYRWST